MAYSDKVVDHFNNPRNMGSFKKDERGVGTGIVLVLLVAGGLLAMPRRRQGTQPAVGR